MLLVRFCCALFSAFIVAMTIPWFVFDLLWGLRCSDYWSPVCEVVFDWLTQLAPLVMVCAAIFWIAAWAGLEIKAYTQSTREKPQLLTHLRYGPIVVLLLSLSASICLENAMIEYSRWQIEHYIHSDVSPWLPPDLDVYHDHRGFCAVGMSFLTHERYAKTAEKYFDDPDPRVRARAIKAGLYLYPGDRASSDVMKKAMTDETLLVRQIAAEYESELATTP